MRLLIINPNTSVTTNERIRAIAKQLVAPPDHVEVVSAESGVELIETVEQSTSTVPAVLAMVNARHQCVDAIIIAAFSDPGLQEAKRVASCPVLGISEAAMKTAARMADRFAIITLGTGLAKAIGNNAQAYGMAGQLVDIKILPWTVAQVSADPKAHENAFANACERAIAEHGIGAVIIGGGPLSGIADTISGDLPIPVLDGVRCAVHMALNSSA